MTGIDDNPWYPTLRVFRRGQKEEWPSVIGRVASALRALNDERAARVGDSQTYDNALMRAGQLIAAAKHDEAEAMLRQLLVQNPDHPETLHHLGIVALKRGRSAEARALIEQALTFDDKLDAAWPNLGVANSANREITPQLK